MYGSYGRRSFRTPALYGTAGSFFKNPVISQEQFTMLTQKYETIPSFPAVHIK